MFGKGQGPTIIGQSVKPINFDFEEANWGDEESILKDIASFKENNSNAIVIMISDDAMFPLFSSGDFVGGCVMQNFKLKQLVNSYCIIETEGTTLVGKISACKKNQITVTSKNSLYPDKNIHDVQIKSIAEVVWHRWRKKII